MSSIYIMGHKNPDVDSICSVLAYAELKKMLGETGYIAARCGNSNARIERVLKRFNAPLPTFIGDLRLRAKNVMKSTYLSLPPDASCFSVMDLIDLHNLRTVPLIDKDKKLHGEVSVFDLGEFFIPRPSEAKQVRHLHATLNDVIKTLGASVHVLFRADEAEDMFVRIGAMEVSTFGSFIEKEDSRAEQNLIVVGDRFDIQMKAIQLGVRALIITGGYPVDSMVLDAAKSKKVSVISCVTDSATTALLVRMATRAAPLMSKNFATVKRDTLLSGISARIKDYFGKTIFVCDENSKVEGVFSNTDFLDLPRPKLILLDHNELSQAVTGAEEADIQEIIDHHRIANAPSSNPILFLNKPVGSTCTIISELFFRANLRPNKQTAGLLLSGIVCDTLNLKGPTTSNEDKIQAEKLSKLAGIDSTELADYIFSSDSVIVSDKPSAVIIADCKHYDTTEHPEKSFSVSQIEELDFANFYGKIEELRAALENYRKSKKLLFSALFVTNVMSQDSVLMLCGSESFASKIAYVKDAERGIFELPKIVSRKKQLVPYLTNLLKDFELS